MEKTVTVSYDEYRDLVDKVVEQAKMLSELHKGSVLIKRELPSVFLSDCGLIEGNHSFIVLTKDDAVKKLADELEKAYNETSSIKQKNEILKVSLDISQVS